MLTMSSFPNQPPTYSDYNAPGRLSDFPSYQKRHDFRSTSETNSDDSRDHDKEGQYAEDGICTFDGITLPVITDANLYIKNIDYDISDDVLYSVFSQLGEITSHHIVRDATKRSRGFGFMSYKTTEQAKRAITELNGRFIGKKPIIVMLHIKKEQRRIQKQDMKDVNGTGGHYLNHFQPQMYMNNGSYEPSYDRGPVYMDDRGQGFDPRRHPEGPYGRSMIGGEYESSHGGHVDSISAQIGYLHQVRKHQEELHSQELIRGEYRMRLQGRQGPPGPEYYQGRPGTSPLPQGFRGPGGAGGERFPMPMQENLRNANSQYGMQEGFDRPYGMQRSQDPLRNRSQSHPQSYLPSVYTEPGYEGMVRRSSFGNVDPYDENRFPKGIPGSVDPYDENRFPKSFPETVGPKVSHNKEWADFEPQSARSEISDVSEFNTGGNDLFARVDQRVDGLGFKNLGIAPSTTDTGDGGFSLFFPQGVDSPKGGSPSPAFTTSPGPAVGFSGLPSFPSKGSGKSQDDGSDLSTLYSEKQGSSLLTSLRTPVTTSESTDSPKDFNLDILNLNSAEQKNILNIKLFPLVKTFKPFLAKSITDFLVNNAEAAELAQVLSNPKLLLPHYIAVALSSMNLASTEI